MTDLLDRIVFFLTHSGQSGDWIINRAAALAVLVAGGLVARQWRQLPLFALLALGWTYLAFQTATYLDLGTLSTAPLTNFPPAQEALYVANFYLVILVLMAAVHGMKRIVISILHAT